MLCSLDLSHELVDLRRRRLMPRSCSMFSLLALVGAPFAKPVPAAQISQISYSVTGGTVLNGLTTPTTITGWSLTLTPVGGSVSTPATSVPLEFLLTFTVGAGTAAQMGFILSGTLVPGGYGNASINSTSAAGPGFLQRGFSLSSININQLRTRTNLNLGTNPNFAKFSFSVAGGTGVGNFDATGLLFNGAPSHTFTLGNEVRTPVPEPSMGSLLGLGLLGLGLIRRR
jgi:hypothetical protein